MLQPDERLWHRSPTIWILIWVSPLTNHPTNKHLCLLQPSLTLIDARTRDTGPGTSELQMRFGLSSGVVTAGTYLDELAATVPAIMPYDNGTCSSHLPLYCPSSGVLRCERSRFQLFGDTVNVSKGNVPLLFLSILCDIFLTHLIDCRMYGTNWYRE
jgi:hypothetical protein